MDMRLVLAAISCAAASGAVTAADVEGTIDEIVVTAQKRAENASDIGVSVAAFDADQLRERAVAQPQDIPALVPNFYVKNTSGSTAPVFTLRGVGVNDFVTDAPPSVGIYVDEVFLSNSGMMGVALFDLDRVEVVKGPQGDLFGRNTTGGFVSFVTRRPTREFEGYATVEAANYQGLKAEAAVSGPLGENLAGRLAVLSRNEFDGWFRNDELGRDWGSIRQFGWRSTLEYVYFNIDNNPWTSEEPYTIVDARVGLETADGAWSLLAWVRNLADEEYFQEAFVSSGANVFGNVGAPRTFGITATRRF